MDFEKCKLYKLKRKRDLFCKLRTTKKEVVLLLNKYKVCINEDNRLLEKPCEALKKLQRKMLNQLYSIGFDDYVFSGIKGRSAQDNALYHLNSKYMLKLDMSKFFPNTHRNNVYEFFLEKLKMAPDVAAICTDIVTVNYDNDRVIIEDNVFNYMKKKGIKIKNHLPSGTPTSQILSYLANIDLFNDIKSYCNLHKISCSIYVDDLTISTNRRISFKEEQELKNIIKKHGHKISKDKTIRYTEREYKKITGFVISPKGKLVLPNKMVLKLKKKMETVDREGKLPLNEKTSILGIINFWRLSNIQAYRGLENAIRNEM